MVREALEITNELGDVILIGAIARYLHTNNLRESQDLDFVMVKQFTDDELIDIGYKKDSRSGKEIWYTPRGIKIDKYTKDVSKIPLESVVENSKYIQVSKKGEKLRTLGLESLIISKHRAKREQDIDDLKIIAETKYREIQWEVLRKISGNEHESNQIKSDMNYLAKSM